MSSNIQRVVLDVLKPHQPLMMDLAKSLCELKGVTGVNLSLYEVDQKTENIKITIKGIDINYSAIKSTIENHGAVIHSIDEVAAGKELIEGVETPQDR
ncbi:MAG: DUF211 domain-containing protein [Methanosarcinales archaeon Met12]|nr:MAG: DUF211 domain-containing protein [Methanosarcinales archaeon Met12]